jgi:hypothetical protein
MNGISLGISKLQHAAPLREISATPLPTVMQCTPNYTDFRSVSICYCSEAISSSLTSTVPEVSEEEKE